MSHRYLADPGSIVYQGRIYLYNSNDDDNNVAGGYSMHSIVCVSTADLKNWTDHGVVFQVPADASWANNSWAPQQIARNGTIYLYFGNNANGVGVASSTSPTGGFKDAKGSYLVNSSTPGAGGGGWLFDPGAMIDDDGQAYLSFGGDGANYAHIIKLGSDLASVSGSAVSPAATVKNFFEASFLFKRNSTYYFAYSSDSSDGLRIDYMTSSSPMTGYTYQGTIAGQPPSNNNNNHASEFEFNGQWYHAYHNRYVSTQAGISTTYKRNLGIEVLNFNGDGTIEQVTYTTDGVPQVGHLDPYVRVEAETMNAQSGIETETCSAGGMDVTQINDGDWVKVRGVDFGASSATSFSASVASTATGGSIELHLGSATGTLIGTCTVPSTGGMQTWMTTTCSVTGATGVQDLVLKFRGSGFNVDYWSFSGPNAAEVDGGSGGSSSAGSSDGGPAGGSSAASSGSGGASGSSGDTGSSSASGTGGSAGDGASRSATSGAGGTASGGSSTSEGAGMSSSSAGEAPGGSNGGCSCHVANASDGRGALAFAALALTLAGLGRRRRQRPSTARHAPHRTDQPRRT